MMLHSSYPGSVMGSILQRQGGKLTECTISCNKKLDINRLRSLHSHFHFRSHKHFVLSQQTPYVLNLEFISPPQSMQQRNYHSEIRFTKFLLSSKNKLSQKSMEEHTEWEQQKESVQPYTIQEFFLELH